MAAPENLFDSTRPFMSPEFIHRVSSDLHEPEEKVEDGFRTVIPTVLSVLIDKGSTPEGAADLIHLLEETPGQSHHAAEDIFGKNYHAVADTLSPSTGLSSDHVEKMMDMIAPVVMRVIGTKVKREGLSPEELKAFLEDQKKVLKGFTPRISRERLLSKSMQDAIAPINRDGEIARIRSKVRPPFALIVTLAVAVIIFSLYLISTGVLRVSELESEFIPALQSPSDRTTSQLPELSILPSFFQDNSVRSKSFSFSETYFDKGTTDLSFQSDKELAFLASQMLKYKKSSLLIDAYMEETGDPEENLRLSENRAMLIREELIGRGVEPSRIRTRGHSEGTIKQQLEVLISK